MVFAGAVGIGIGLAMQNLASSLISGFVIIFGGKIRKGDWLDVNGTIGEVQQLMEKMAMAVEEQGEVIQGIEITTAGVEKDVENG